MLDEVVIEAEVVFVVVAAEEGTPTWVHVSHVSPGHVC